MPEFDDLRTKTLTLFSELSEIAQSRGAGEAVQRLAAGRQLLLDERLVVVVCGEFKRGKSSLLNALLEEPDLFPVDAFFATCLITTAGYAPEETISVTVAEEDGSLRQLVIKRGDIASYATESGNPRNVKRAQLISIETPNPRLANGLMFVDTPGVGGVYRRRRLGRPPDGGLHCHTVLALTVWSAGQLAACALVGTRRCDVRHLV